MTRFIGPSGSRRRRRFLFVPLLCAAALALFVTTGSQAVLLVASTIFLIVTLADLIVQVGQTFVTGRTAERIMLSLRIRIWAHLQRLSLDYYEREMAGRIMTRMTTDVDALSTFLQTGLSTALISVLTVLGVAVALQIGRAHV